MFLPDTSFPLVISLPSLFFPWVYLLLELPFDMPRMTNFRSPSQTCFLSSQTKDSAVYSDINLDLRAWSLFKKQWLHHPYISTNQNLSLNIFFPLLSMFNLPFRDHPASLGQIPSFFSLMESLHSLSPFNNIDSLV